MRSGTLPTPIIVGLGEAAAVCQREMENDTRHVRALAKKLHEGLEGDKT